MSSPDMTLILEQLAAGSIDLAEAQRRIAALKAADKAAPAADDSASTPLATPPGPSQVTPPTTPQPPTPPGPGVRPTPLVPPSPPTPSSPRPTEPSNEELRDREGWSSSDSYPRPPFFSPNEPVDEVPPAARRTGNNSTKGVERITVHAVGRRVRIVGDYSVSTVAAEGPHILRRHGAVLEVSSDGEIGPSLDGFSMLRPPRSLDDIRNMSLGKELFLRVHPAITVDVEVTAGSLTTDKVPYLGKVRVTAGSATLTHIAEANDVLVQAGTATLKGSFRTGRSRIRVESGNLNVQLDDDSNVTVKGESQLGKINWLGPLAHGHVDETVMGNGAARLDVGVVMGYATVKLGGEQ